MTTEATKDEYEAGASSYLKAMSDRPDLEVEIHAFFQNCGDLYGKHVLDVACGAGRYSRLLKERGAAHVEALDISEEQCKIARAHADQAVLQIEYRQHDMAEPLPAAWLGAFDLVCSQSFLCYAPNKEMLERFVRNAFDACKPGALFVNLTDNPALTPDQYNNFQAYGYHKKTDAVVGPDGWLPEGSKVTWVFSAGFESDVWIWHPSTYREVMEKAGFVDVEFFGFTVPPKYVFDRKMVEHCAPRIVSPPIIGLKGFRPCSPTGGTGVAKRPRIST